MQAACRILDQIKTTRTGRVTGLCFLAVIGLLVCSGVVQGPSRLAGQESQQPQDSILDRRESYCPGPETKPTERRQVWCKKFAQKLAAEVASSDEAQGCSIVFYGDSITETWRGSDNGGPCPRCKGVPEVFQQYFGSRYSSEVLAVGGDQSMHLLWRLQHGEVFRNHEPRVAIVMIGTNDLGAASCLAEGEAPILQAAAGTADRIACVAKECLCKDGGSYCVSIYTRVTEVVRYLHEQNPSTHVLILGLLPRGSGNDPKEMFNLPSDYSRAMAAVNDHLERYAFGNKQLHFADCSVPFTVGGKLSPELMPDALHPNAAGMALLAECILPFLKLYAPIKTQASRPA